METTRIREVEPTTLWEYGGRLFGGSAWFNQSLNELLFTNVRQLIHGHVVVLRLHGEVEVPPVGRQ